MKDFHFRGLAISISVDRGVLFLAAVLQGAAYAQAPLPFQLHYEENAFARPDALSTLSARPRNPNALYQDCSVARKGQCSLRSQVRAASDFISADAYRAESHTMDLLATRYSPGEHWRYRFSVKLPTEWVFAPVTSIDILWQFKRFELRPDLFLAVKGQALVLRVLGKEQRTVLPVVPLGQWLDVDLNVKWAADASGAVQARIFDTHGKLLANTQYSGPTTWDTRPSAAYVKWGLYKPGKTDGSFSFPDRWVWHDEISMEKLPAVGSK